jgi:tetratricopeptide (TPR) repeat protein
MRSARSNADFAVALSDFSAAIRLAPDDPYRYVDRAEVRRKMSDFAGAIADLRLGLERLPWDDGGRAAIESRIRVFEAHIAADQATAWRVCTSRAPSDEAVSACTEYISAASAGDRRLAEVYAARAETFAARGDAERALGDYSAAIRIAPDSPAAYVGRGGVRAGQGEYQGAIADYGKAIDLQPDLADGYYGRGVAHQEIGELTDALDDLREAVSLFVSPDDPRLADAKSRIADIERDLRPPQIAEVPSEPQVDDKPDSALEAEYFGTGIVVSADGAILTNEHVIEECETFFVRRDQQSFESADYVASNPANDLALLRTRRPIPEGP